MKLVEERVYVSMNDAYEANFMEVMEMLCYFKDRENYIKQLEDKQKNRMTT